MASMDDLAARTDSYFLKTKAIVDRFGDREATYAVFMRRPVVSAPRFAIEFLERMAAQRAARCEIELNRAEAEWVGAGEPILHERIALPSGRSRNGTVAKARAGLRRRL
jgi:nicotinate phosphoribosyltransferase